MIQPIGLENNFLKSFFFFLNDWFFEVLGMRGSDYEFVKPGHCFVGL